jgi:hypothetical protein
MRKVTLGALSDSSYYTRSMKFANYNTDNSIASATIDGISYSFTYIGGKLSKVASDTVTTLFTWVEGKLLTVEVK